MTLENKENDCESAEYFPTTADLICRIASQDLNMNTGTPDV